MYKSCKNVHVQKSINEKVIEKFMCLTFEKKIFVSNFANFEVKHTEICAEKTKIIF
jgi:hypothetical protein